MAELNDIPGVGPATAGALTDRGLGSVKKVAKAKVKQVAKVPGFGEVRARRVRDAARDLVEAQSKPKKKGKGKGKKGKR